MGIKFLKKCTPGTRNRSVYDFIELSSPRRHSVMSGITSSLGEAIVLPPSALSDYVRKKHEEQVHKDFLPPAPSERVPAVEVKGIRRADSAKPCRQKKLTFYNQRAKGRNNRGIITCRHHGGGHKRLYRNIDFRRDKIGVPAKVISIEYDPNRNARIALLRYLDGEKTYILQPRGLVVGDIIISNIKAPILLGNSLPLRNIPLGTEVHNVELQAGSGGKLARAAGSLVEVLAKEGNFVTIRLPSKEIRLISKNCWATIGQVGNIEAYTLRIGKAGRSRWLGIRPTVRGSAMNPVDHPHGGGEGRAPIGHKHPLTPWGRHTLGKLTRHKKKYSNFLIIRKRK